MTTPHPDFDVIARPYRWLEYMTLGRTLERCRLHFLPQMADRTRALVLGDGDGRFLAALMARNVSISADAVDTSATMLKLLQERCGREANNVQARLKTQRADALSYLAASPASGYDLVVTHFFLDCLAQPEMNALASAVAERLAPNALWVVSDFCIPEGTMRLPAKVLVRGLYLAFRILTGLRTNKLPDHAHALLSAGFVRKAQKHSLFGVLTTELWSRA